MRMLVLLCSLFILCACGGGGSGSDPTPHPARGIAALYFDGVDDRVSIDTPAWGSTSLAAGLTVEAWVHPQTLVEHPEFAGIVDVGVHGLALGNDAGLGNQTRFFMSVSAPARNGALSVFDALEAGTWQHLAGTYDGTTIRIYRNGVQLHEVGHVGTATTATQALIGWRTASFHGVIDEVRIWGKARTQTQLADGMDTSLSGTESGLLGYYRFEGSGQQVVDSSARGAHGLLGLTGAAESTDPVRVAE